MLFTNFRAYSDQLPTLKHYREICFPLPALILSIVAMFFAGCETDYVVSDDLSPAEGPLECIHKDCVTGTNPDVAVVSSEQKTEIPLLTLQTAFFEHYSISTHLQRFNDDGYPA